MVDKNRKARENIDKDDFNFLAPIDVLTLGSDDDPCFGKFHDLKAPECMECGDAEFCAIMKGQNLHKDRIKIESTQRFKDIEEADYEMTQVRRQIKNLITKYQSEGYPRLKTVLVISKKLKVSKDIVKELYDKS
jgi:hypothetical protein